MGGGSGKLEKKGDGTGGEQQKMGIFKREYKIHNNNRYG